MQFMNYINSYKFTITGAAVVLVLLLLPSQFFPKTPRTFIELDKVVHAILFGAVTAIFCAEHFARERRSPPFFLTLIIVAAFAMLTEMSQLFTRTRHFDMRDFAADMVGIAIVLASAKLLAMRHGTHRT